MLKELQVSPNPAISGAEFKINVNLSHKGKLMFYLKNITRKKVCTGKMGTFTEGKHEITCRLPEGLYPGIYYLILNHSDGGQATHRILVEMN
jgi:hypothetical protein